MRPKPSNQKSLGERSVRDIAAIRSDIKRCWHYRNSTF